MKVFITIVVAAIFVITVIFALVNIEHFGSRYADLVITIIGSCIGFGLALIGSRVIEEFSDERRIKIAKANVEDELKFICEKLFYPNGTSEITDNKLYFDTPIWSSVVSTGDILKIRKHDKFFRSALASYRRLELLQEDEARIDWDNLNPEERQKIIATRRDVRRIVDENLDVLSKDFKSPKKIVKDRKVAVKEDETRLKALRDWFEEISKDKNFPDPNSIETKFKGRDKSKDKSRDKGFFFSTPLLNEAFEDNAKYGIGFGEYDCEIYLSISTENDKDGTSGFDKYLSYLNRLDSVKSKDTFKTQYTYINKNKVSVNYSRIVLASSHYKKGCTRKTISKDTIERMLGELQEFEDKWLKPLLREKP